MAFRRNLAEQLKFDEEKGLCTLFLQNYIDELDALRPKYTMMLQEIANRERRTLDIDLDDVAMFFETGQQHASPDLITHVEMNTNRYVKLFAEAADSIMPSPSSHDIEPDVFDVLAQHRQQRNPPDNDRASSLNQVPAELLRRYDVYLHPRTKAECSRLRGITAQDIGHLVKIRGIVTHVTDVRPLVSVVAYTDPDTGYEIYQEVLGRTFMPIEATKPYEKAKNPPVMETRGSKFKKFQEAKIQEMADEVPEGATPRSISVHLRGEICRSMKPGDEVILSGIFLTEPYTGFRAMKAGLLTATYLEAMAVQQVKTSYSNHQLSEKDAELLASLAEGGDVYSRLAASIAPEIYGHEDVKKALLLLMVGGRTRHMADGMKLRGDVHMCLMGDPGVAKSQLLKYVARVSPRAVYTTGKGSSGVGLTAAVQRNKLTKELVLEGGALVLADKGICCIDEFDKMDESDRTAIHEVMEQQTVSIAKAGITTTLNTRTTLLAAANPAWGRYDRRRTPAENINLPAALLSRFDLLWLILDESHDEMDRRLAEHVLSVHRYGHAPVQDGPAPLSADVLRTYIAQAKTYEPHIPRELTEYIAGIYAEMRQLEKLQSETTATYTTPRTLLSILRLSQAVAKLRFDMQVIQADVDEALRLMKQSKASLNNEQETTRKEDNISICYSLIRQEANKQQGQASLTLNQIVDLTAKYNISREDILTCIQEYADIAVWSVEYDLQGDPIVVLAAEENVQH